MMFGAPRARHRREEKLVGLRRSSIHFGMIQCVYARLTVSFRCILLAAVAIAMVTLYGCKKPEMLAAGKPANGSAAASESLSGPITSASLVGTWSMSAGREHYTFRLRADGTFDVHEMSAVKTPTGNWKFDGKVLTLSFTRDSPHWEQPGMPCAFELGDHIDYWIHWFFQGGGPGAALPPDVVWDRLR